MGVGECVWQALDVSTPTYEQLFENNRRWVAEELASDPDHFERLAAGQHPKYLFIGCSDSRVNANEMVGVRSGEMFIHRNIANLVVHTDMNLMSVLQFAVEVLEVEHVIVCGHYGCGGVAAAVDGSYHGLIDKWLRTIKDVYRIYHDELDAIFNDARFARALWGVRIESLRDGRVVYARNSDKLVVPASNMKLFTMAATAQRLGWDFTFETRLEAVGTITDGTLDGDLIVVGGGDPSIDSVGFGPAPVFEQWADALKKAGIHRVTGRLVGDDSLFDDEGIGPGWAWDYLNDGYAAPSSALSYNENIAIIRNWPGASVGASPISARHSGSAMEKR